MTPAPHSPARVRLDALVAAIAPFDATERDHLAAIRAWLASDAPVYRTGKPDIPPRHLVAYFIPYDEETSRILVTAHRKSGLDLPPGGHVEPDEDPWSTVVREADEELRLTAKPWRAPEPFFATVTTTRGAGQHVDVSLWYVLRTSEAEISWFDESEFTATRWARLDEILAEPIDGLDPHMHRFAGKLASSG